MDIDHLARLAHRHHGAIDRVEAAVSTSAWHRGIRSGWLVPLHPNVARLAGTLPTTELRIAAAVLAVGPKTIASHRSAIHLWGIGRPVGDGPVDVIAPARGGHHPLDGVIVHRPRDQRRLWPPQRRSGIPCTNILRSLCDLGAVAAPLVTRSVVEALSQRLVTLDALLTTVIEHSEHGRHGIVALRTAVDDCAIDFRPADSVLELAMEKLVRTHRLPPVEFHSVIEGGEVDFRVTGTCILIECDGWATHGLQRDQFERDRRRDAALAAAGWITIRLTYRAIIFEPSTTAARVRAVVDQWTCWR